jgi:uncharacterized membrane protein
MRPLTSVGTRTRLRVMVFVGALAAAVTGQFGSWTYAPITGWDGAALTFMIWVWLTVARLDPDRTKHYATREDPGRAASDVIVVIAAIASLAAVGGVLIQAASAKGHTQDLLAGLGVGSVTLSWLAVHTLFMLRYAFLYYTGVAGGIDFNQHELLPRYLDFAYLSFTIGMTFQVSDTDLTTKPIRQTAIKHALLSYLFGAVIVAITINVVGSLLSK